jgi:hypothetical protein
MSDKNAEIDWEKAPDDILWQVPIEKITPTISARLSTLPDRPALATDDETRKKGAELIEKALGERSVADQINHIEFHLGNLGIPYRSIIKRGYNPDAAYNADATIGDKLRELSELKKVKDKTILYKDFRGLDHT